MKKRIIFYMLAWLLGPIAASATALEAGTEAARCPIIKGDSIVLTDSAGNRYKVPMSVIERPQPKKNKKQVRPKRIDREVMRATFIPRGQWMAGGTISYQEHDAENYNFLVLKNVEGLGYTFKVSPYVGYFFRNNMAAGVRFAYNRTYLDMDNFEVNLGEDLNINLKDLYWLEHKYEVGGFLRTYMPIGRSKIFGFFNELRLSYGYATGKDSTGSGTEYDGTFERTHSLQIGMAPGLAAFITDFSAVEVSVGVMGYDFKWVNQKTNQIETGTRRTSSGNFKINLFSINIGMTFYL